MATDYHDVLADIALRINAFTATTPEDMQVAYATRPLVSTLFDSTIAPFSALISALLLAEEKLVSVMASTSNPTLRSYLSSVTANLASGDIVPRTDVSGAPIIGVLGSVRDASDGTPCKEKTLEEIERRNRNAGNFYRIPMYAYKFDGVRIEHTRTEVAIDCCIYDRAAQEALVESNGEMLLPDDLGEAVICGAVASLIRDDEYVEQATVYAKYFEDTLTRISAGLSPIPVKVTPGPTALPSSN